MLAATLVPRRRAAKFQNAAHTTAIRGDSTRVDTTVAIEFAASWKPLKKSNASATKTTNTSAMSGVCSGMLQGDRLDGVRDVLARVDGRLHLIDDVLPLQDVHGPELARVQAGHGLPVDPVPLVLQAVHLDEVPVLPLEGPESSDGLEHRVGHPDQGVRLLAEFGEELVDPVQHEK